MLSPKDLELPEKFTSWRPSQYEAAVSSATCGDYALLVEGPTGTGKSLIGAAAQRIRSVKTTYLVQTKQLQDQILQDFPYAMTLKGRNNYRCLRFPNKFPEITAAECTHTKMNPCEDIHGCPYIVAKIEALSAPLAVLNYSYFLYEVNYASKHTKHTFSGRKFTICDEVDTTEDELMNFIQLTLTQKQLDRLGLEPPRFKTKFESWVEWARPAERQIIQELDRLEKEVESATSWTPIDMRALRRYNEYTRLKSKLEFFIREVDQNWVWYPGEDQWTFKPVWIAKYSPIALWNHTEKVLGMSATILDPTQLTRNVGLTLQAGRTYKYLPLPSPFPKENRPIYYEPCANLTNKTMATELPKLGTAVDKILNYYPNEKILLHSVSYKVRDYLVRNSACKQRMMTHSTGNRAEVLGNFKKSAQPMVLVSPSMDRGVDLPQEECRVIIIAKVPYPDLGDPQTRKRVYGSKDGNHWYAHKTISSIVQMAGRGVRSEDDYAYTYILDSQFGRLLSNNKDLFPQWFGEALVM